MEDFTIANVNLVRSENHKKHRTDAFSSSKTLVVRRGAPFMVSLQPRGRPFNPKTDSLRVKVMLGRLYAVMPVTFSRKVSSSRWEAYFDQNANLRKPTIFISSPASASVGVYSFQLYAVTGDKKSSCAFGKFTLLCNPWCEDDAVFIPFEDQREEYVQNDSSLLFMGTPTNVVSRPWSLDQNEPGVLEVCLNLLKVSPQHQKNRRRDYLNRNNPAYISRVVSAMINCQDDCGVLRGNWSGNFKDGVPPSQWTGSGDILKAWARSGCHPVKYGQCWVFAAVMCTVMRVLGIPCRIITNYDSAHDTNKNLVIEEFYSETGKKLSHTKDSVWNFHVWVECWMTRRDLGHDMDGWQVLDPTPQERSGGVYCCGPAPVKAIRDKRVDLPYDVPFVFAAVNADVYTMIVSRGRVVSQHRNTERVGSLICTKAVGFPQAQNITGNYKHIKSPSSTISSRSFTMLENSTSRGGDVDVSLILDKDVVAGEPIHFTLKIINRKKVTKTVKVHLNAQAKEYNSSPSDTFWENHGITQLAPMEVKVTDQYIYPAQYEDVVGEDHINLAAVVEDVATQELILVSEEFNITSPQLLIETVDKDAFLNMEQTATITFTNPYSHPVHGALTVAGPGLIQGKLHFRLVLLRPGGRMVQQIPFTPVMKGKKMLQASLALANMNSTIRGFKMVTVI